MKLYNKETGELASIEKIERRGSVLLVKGVIFGSMPLEAELRPQEARQALKLLNARTLWFLITLLFRPAVAD